MVDPDAAALDGDGPAIGRVHARFLAGFPVQSYAALLPQRQVVEIDAVPEQQLVPIRN
jgi:hypothetical protein